MLHYSYMIIIIITAYRSYSLPHTFPWPQLRSLTLESHFNISDITSAIVLLKEFSSSTLKDVTVKFQLVSIYGIMKTLDDEAGSKQCKELDQTLKRFSQAQGVWNLPSIYDGAKAFWTQKLREHFFGLSSGEALIVTEQKGI